MKLVSVDNVKLLLTKDESTDDKLVGLIIDKVSSRIESFLNRNLQESPRSQYFNAGRRYYYLPAYPISLSPTAPVVNVDDVTKTINEDYYIWENRGLVEFYTIPSYTKPKQVYITWTGGYQADGDGVLPVPDDIKEACLLQSAFMYKRRNDLGLASVKMGDGAIQILQAIKFLPEVRQALLPHRRFPSTD